MCIGSSGVCCLSPRPRLRSQSAFQSRTLDRRLAHVVPRLPTLGQRNPSYAGDAGDAAFLPRAPRDSVVDPTSAPVGASSGVSSSTPTCDRVVGTAVGRDGLRVLLPRETNKRDSGSGGAARRVSGAGLPPPVGLMVTGECMEGAGDATGVAGAPGVGAGATSGAVAGVNVNVNELRLGFSNTTGG